MSSETFNINSIDQLEESAAYLAKFHQELSNDTESLDYILDQIQANWQSEIVGDLQSIIEELNDCISKLNSAILPTIKEFSSTMNILAVNARANASKTI